MAFYGGTYSHRSELLGDRSRWLPGPELAEEEPDPNDDGPDCMDEEEYAKTEAWLREEHQPINVRCFMSNPLIVDKVKTALMCPLPTPITHVLKDERVYCVIMRVLGWEYELDPLTRPLEEYDLK